MFPLYIGIDDTDNLETRGTGYRARQLVSQLQENGLATVTGVTRHQLFFDDRIPYTSHNSSACLAITPCEGCDADDLMEFCRGFLLTIAADGSDVGLCIADQDQARQVSAFGKAAKTTVLQKKDAYDLAGNFSIKLEGLTGDHQGIIGALAGTGLHRDGNDGRYIWVKGIRDHENVSLSLSDLLNKTGVEKVSLHGGSEVKEPDAMIELGPWPRPVRIDGQAVLLVEKQDGKNQYKVLEKDIIKSIRP